MALVPALPSIVLYGGELTIERIRARVLAAIPSQGIDAQALFDTLDSNEYPGDNMWVVCTMEDRGEIRVHRSVNGTGCLITLP